MPIFECVRCNEMTYSASFGSSKSCAHCGNAGVRVFEGGFAEARASRRELCPADHAAVVYDDASEIAPFCARYLTEGVDAGDCVVAAVPADLGRLITALLAPDVAAIVDWHDARTIYCDFDADRVAATYDAMIRDEPRTTRILAAIDGESADGVEPAEFDRYERIAHAIVTELRANVVCLYDAQALPPELLDIAARRHGLRVEHGAARRNEQFEYAPA